MRMSIVFLIGFISVVRAQSPGVRNGHAMVYDQDQHAMILFGGANEKKVCKDTWSYAGGKWKKLAEDGPGYRTFPGMVMADHYILLFGGNRLMFGDDHHPAHYLDDTWIFREGSWKKLELAVHPGPRAEMAMGYDPVRRRILLFGGRQSGTKWILGDSWEFDGTKWIPINKPGPCARSGAVMAYDPELKQLVMFGGNPVIAKESDYNGPMWSWDGKLWHRIPVMDSLVFNSCMVYDIADHFLLRFGGWNGSERLSDSWTFQDGLWKKLNSFKSPAARNHAIMAYDNDTGACILFGGHNGEYVFGDLWSFKRGKWDILHIEKPLKRVDNGH